MPKLVIKAFDEKREYKINKAKIVTPIYSSRIKEKQVHSPSTALFVASGDHVGYEFILYHPLIECDSIGDITIYTDKPFNDIIVSDSHHKFSKDYKLNKAYLKMLQSKMKIGATIDEVWKYEEVRNEVETGKVLKKNSFYKVMGGVK